MTILSVQSRVAFGSVGNAAAVPVLQALGHDVTALDTVRFSNHPGYGTFRGAVTPAADLVAHMDGLSAIGVLDSARAVLSGYVGSVENAGFVCDLVTRVRERRPEIPYVCDPVIGDRHTGSFVSDGIARLFADRAVGASDFLIPNAFELEILLGQAVGDQAGKVVEAAQLLVSRMRPVRSSELRHAPAVIVTSVHPDGDDSRIGAVVVTQRERVGVFGPRLDGIFHGCGDVLAAAFTGALLDPSGGTADPVSALRLAVSATHAVLSETLAAGKRELAMAASLPAIRRPPRLFDPVSL